MEPVESIDLICHVVIATDETDRTDKVLDFSPPLAFAYLDFPRVFLKILRYFSSIGKEKPSSKTLSRYTKVEPIG